MTLSFMPDSRQDVLVKAAKDCISLMNVGSDPNESLYKVAEDAGLNDNEVVLVSHAVNNGALLGHLQEADEDHKGDSFPLTNAKVVIEKREKELRTPQSTKDLETKPDALDIKDEIAKEASFIERVSYRKIASVSVEDIRAELSIPHAIDLPSAELDHPLAAEQRIKTAMDEASARYTSYYGQAAALVDSLCGEFAKLSAPKFAAFEEAALAAGASGDLVDLIYANGALEGIGQTRLAKTASARTVVVSPAVGRLVEDCVRANTFMKHASDALVELEQLREEFNKVCVKAAAEDEKKQKGPDGYDRMVGDAFPVWNTASVDISPDKQLAALENAGRAPMDLFSQEGTNEITGLANAAIGNVGPTSSIESKGVQDLGGSFNQSMENIDTAATVQRLMNDDFIKGHSVAEVVEAYNDALSVNPSFSETELKAYIRQHLASQGAMPLDLMLRARQKGPGAAP